MFNELKKLSVNNPLFEGFSEELFADLDRLIVGSRSFEPNEFLLRQGDDSREVFIIESGRVEILVKEEDTEKMHALATLGPGDCVGEVALLDSEPRSASAKAINNVKVLVLQIANMENNGEEALSVLTRMKLNLARSTAQRMRTSNEGAVRTLHDMLEESEKRVEMGKFMGRVLIGTCIYTFALAALKGFSNLLGDTTFITVPLLVAFAIGIYLNIKTSIYPASDYGLTTRNWKPALKEAILFSLPVLVLIVLIKWILIQTSVMEGHVIFDFYRSKGTTLPMTLLAFSLYATFAPIQELVARSGMQSSFEMFLTGKYKTWFSIFLSTLLFSSTHLHVSFILAVLVFPLGLFWGWLYSRYPTLVGVAASHVLIGSFGLFIVGFPTKGAA